MRDYLHCANWQLVTYCKCVSILVPISITYVCKDRPIFQACCYTYAWIYNLHSCMVDYKTLLLYIKMGRYNILSSRLNLLSFTQLAICDIKQLQYHLTVTCFAIMTYVRQHTINTDLLQVGTSIVTNSQHSYVTYNGHIVY